MFNDEQLKIVCEMINRLVDCNTVAKQPVYTKPKR